MGKDKDRGATARNLKVETKVGKVVPTKKAFSVVLEEAEVIELMRILMDDDARGALDFLKLHFKGKAKELLESRGCKG